MANYRATCAAGWTDEYADVVAAMHIMAVLLGVLNPGGEWKIIDNKELVN